MPDRHRGYWGTHRLVERAITLAIILSMVCSGLAVIVPTRAQAVGNPEDRHEHESDYDARGGSVQPSARQQGVASRLVSASDGAAASAVSVRWNRFGTPRSMIRHGGYLATGLSGATAVDAARNWISANRQLFKLSSVAGLQLANDARMSGSNGHAVSFRQVFNGLAATQDGLITVGVTGTRASGWKVAYVSSSLTGDTALAASASLTDKRAWQIAASSVGRNVALSSITKLASSQASSTDLSKNWSIFKVAGFYHPQRARLVALPTPLNGVRPAYESIVLDTSRAEPLAYRVFVDAATGKVLVRHNQVDHLSNMAPAAASKTQPFAGTYTPTTCGPRHDFAVPAGQTAIFVEVKADNPADDLVLELYRGTTLIERQDTFTNPEAIRYAPQGGVPAGTYSVRVCPYTAESQVAPYVYEGTFTYTDEPIFGNMAKWKYFRANPPQNYDTIDTRILGCWNTVLQGDPPPAGCARDEANLASRTPWDVDPRTNQPTFTTFGNNAYSAESWLSIVFGPTFYSPVSLQRRYVYAWQNTWNEQKCNPAVFATGLNPDNTHNGNPNANDRAAAAVNLFVSHNRHHDFAYYLGFTERNYNMQLSNFGNTPPGPFPTGFEVDPLLGAVQAAAIIGGYPTFFGRDNAFMITLPDGMPSLTSMFLWQPIPGSFYAPCVDGDFDVSVIGHEYTHATSNRMIGGPDGDIDTYQGRAMGESWSDLIATEYLREYGYVPTNGENPWAVGTYATGNKYRGIRNYPMNRNPLNYSDLGYDLVGAQVHADGEIWTATNFDIRQLLAAKYNGAYPASNQAVQRQCADGVRPASLCPGNRRWVQIVFDAFLLMPSTVDMVDARDAYLAADMMRFGGANQRELWLGFARRGLGRWAATNGGEDPNARPSFVSPRERNAQVTFKTVRATAGDTQQGGTVTPINARIFVGDYHARVRPIADTFAATALTNTAGFAPGTYRFLVQAPGYGLFRFTRTFTAGQQVTLQIAMPTNWASRHKGAVASGQGDRLMHLIDDSENTNWERTNDVTATGNTIKGSRVTVDLAGGVRKITRVQVSAMLRPPREVLREDDVPQNRFTALRQFQLQVCTASTANSNCTAGGFRTVYTSPANAFPGVRPRPVAPNLIVRNFDIPDVSATHVRLVVVSNQCTGGPDYQGEQDNDPRYGTDCDTNSSRGTVVRAAELEVFDRNGSVTAIGDDQQG